MPRPKKNAPKRQAGEAKRAAAKAGAAAAALARVRKLCFALPGTAEKLAWGAPTFRVGGRLYCMFVDNHHGDGRLALWLAAPAGAQEAFVAADPERFFKPPYVGPSGWLGVRLDRRLPWSAVAGLLEEAHGAIAAKAKARKR